MSTTGNAAAPSALHRLPATELVAGYRARRFSPVEVTRACLAAIAARNGALNAFLVVLEESALEQARASEARWLTGAPQGALDGVPVTVKDLCATVDAPTRYGSRTSSAAPGTVDAPCVARLREAGAVLLGKTAMCEFGWKGVTDSPLLGVSRNPWDRRRTCGGSSGGAAIAAATGMGALHVGSDGAGSIRIPAAFCGVYGFKATFGRVPAWPPGRAALGHHGPLTRTVEDA
ncbi:MAG: amidase, partial [Burkholderiales bacterium]|nr:amidase [Burkholderiales bacterium]